MLNFLNIIYENKKKEETNYHFALESSKKLVVLNVGKIQS